MTAEAIVTFSIIIAIKKFLDNATAITDLVQYFVSNYYAV